MSERALKPAQPAPEVGADEAEHIRARRGIDCYGTLLQLKSDNCFTIQALLHDPGVDHATGGMFWEAWLERPGDAKREGRNLEAPPGRARAAVPPFSRPGLTFFGEAFKHHSVETIPGDAPFSTSGTSLDGTPAYPEVARVFSVCRIAATGCDYCSKPMRTTHLEHALEQSGNRSRNGPLIERRVVQPRKPFFRAALRRLELEPCEVLLCRHSPGPTSPARKRGLPGLLVSRYPESGPREDDALSQPPGAVRSLTRIPRRPARPGSCLNRLATHAGRIWWSVSGALVAGRRPHGPFSTDRLSTPLPPRLGRASK